MDVATISNASNMSTQQPLAAKTRSSVAIHKGEESEESRQSLRKPHHGGRHPGGRALGIFRQEMQYAIKSRLHAKFAINQTNHARAQGDATPTDVAADSVGAMKQAVAAAPTRSGKALIAFRATVHETASFVRETVGMRENTDDVDAAVRKIDDGLDALQRRVDRSQDSSASVLKVDTNSKQRSTIRIRTQEGDVVKLSIRRHDRMEARDTSRTDGGSSSTRTEVEVSSRSRMMLKIDGDLNEEELAAIQNVFAQAEDIAAQFFGGDIAAAFSLAAGLEFDSAQLARVRMGFRSDQSSNIAYRETAGNETVAAAAGDTTSASRATPVTAKRVIPDPTPKLEDSPQSSTSKVSTNAATETSRSENGTVAGGSSVVDPSAPDSGAGDPFGIGAPSLSDFFGLLSDFLRSVGEGFGDNAQSGTTSIRFHYSESFKLEILKSVIHTLANPESEPAAATAAAVIDSSVVPETEELNLA